MDYTFMLYSFWNHYQPISMTKKQSKLEFQFSRISHFMTLWLPGAPRGGTKIILTCTKWPNLNYQTIFGSILIVISTHRKRGYWAQMIHPPLPIWILWILSVYFTLFRQPKINSLAEDFHVSRDSWRVLKAYCNKVVWLKSHSPFAVSFCLLRTPAHH